MVELSRIQIRQILANLCTNAAHATVFKIFLPAVKAGLATQEPEFDRKLLQGSGQILLFDDEKMLINTGHQLLEALGYQVTSTTDPEEALGRTAMIGIIT